VRSQVLRGRVARAATAVAVVGALLGGCGSGPSQVGSAAIVGSTAIPASDVQARLDQAFARPEIVEQLTAEGVGAPDIARDVVTQAVLHQLSVAAAQAAGIVVTPAEIDRELVKRGGVDAVLKRSLFGLPLVRERIGDELIAERLAAEQIDGLAVTVDILGVPSRDEAADAAQALAAGGAAADALFVENPQTSLRGYEYRAATNPDVATTPVFGTPAGGTGYFQPVPGQDSWIVFHVVDRRLDAPRVAPQLNAVPALGQEALVTIGTRLLQPVAAEVGVRVNPRYGVWDPIAMRVLDEEQVAGAVLPAAAPPTTS